jgi:hypothetical protein
VFSLLNNILEIRVDAAKILFTVQRTEYEGASDIGMWMSVLEFMSVLGVMTNTAIICFTSQVLKGRYVHRDETLFGECMAACTPKVDQLATDWATYVPSADDSWLDAWHAEKDSLDITQCFNKCSCTGRCMPVGDRFLVFILAEHLIFLFKFALDYFIPDVPKKIARALVWKEVLGDTIKNQLRQNKAAGEVSCYFAIFIFVPKRFTL